MNVGGTYEYRPSSTKKPQVSAYNILVKYPKDSPKAKKLVKHPKHKNTSNKIRNNKNKFRRYSKRPKIGQRIRPVRNGILFRPKNILNPFHRNLKLPQWRPVTYNQNSRTPNIIQMRNGVTLGDWNSPVVDNLVKVKLTEYFNVIFFLLSPGHVTTGHTCSGCGVLPAFCWGEKQEE